MADNLEIPAVPDNSFLQAIDTHNVANGDTSWFEKKLDSTGELISDTGKALTYGVPDAAIAGVNSIINTGKSIGNFLGMETEQTKTYDILKDLDSNLSDYYKAHEQGVEIGGFVLGSIVPGMLGVKALQMAKGAILGTNMIRSLGLTESLTADYATAAIRDFNLSSSPFTMINANTIKAVAQGFGSEALDAAAFNTAATASMYKSPMFDGQSISDIFWDDVTGSLLWGGIGGAVKGVKTVYGINKGINTVNAITQTDKFITELDNNKNIPPVMNVLNAFENKFRLTNDVIPNISAEGNSIATGITDTDLISLRQENSQKTLTKINNNINLYLNEFAGGDTQIGNAIFEATKDATKIEDIFTSLGPFAKKAERIGTEDTIAPSDVYYLNHGKSYEDFQTGIKSGNFEDLFTGTGKDSAKGYEITGDMKDLLVSGAKSSGLFSAGSKENAFANGIDIFRNPNGTLSINPESNIIKEIAKVPDQNKILVDLQNGNEVKLNATPGLADLATKNNPIVIKGDTVLAGNLNPIKMKTSVKYSPLDGLPHEAQARTIWAQTANIKFDGMRVGEYDLPLLERIYQEGQNLADKSIYLIKNDGTAIAMPREETLRNYIDQQKQSLFIKGSPAPVDELSTRLNTTDKYLTDGTAEGWMNINKATDIQTPRYAKIVYDPTKLESMPMMNTMNHQGALEYARQKALITENVKQNFAKYSGDMYDLFPEELNPNNPIWKSAGQGAGSGLFSFANGNYGTMAAWAQSAGSFVDRLVMNKKTAVAETLNNAFSKATVKNNEAQMEAAIFNNTARRHGEGFMFHPDGSNSMIPAKDFDGVAAGKFDPSIVIPFKNEETANVIKQHIEINDESQSHIGNMKGTAGIGDNYRTGVYYPIPIDTQTLKHFVLVKPRAPVSLDDKARVIAAKDEETLKSLVAQIDQTQFSVQTKAENIEFHKAVGNYDSALGLNDSTVDSALTREGKLSQHFPDTANFFDEMLNWHMRQQELLARSMVYHRYSQMFEELKNLGSSETNLATSQFQYLTKGLEQSVKDPYNDIIKTALNISRTAEYQPWVNFNTFVKDAVEQPINKLRDIFKTNPKIDDEFVSKVNSITEDMGQKPAFQNAASLMLANGNIPYKPWLSQGIAKVQSVMSTTLLQWDTMNALNNIMGNGILSAPEISKVLAGIRSGNSDIVGKLTDLLNIKVPNTVDASGAPLTTLTTGKLIKNAVDNYSRDPAIRDALMERYRSINTITDLSLEARDSFNHLLIDWKNVTQGEAQTSIEKAADFGRKWTGNQRAEEFNRFVASDIMRQLTDMAEGANIMSRTEANTYIQTFVNRTQGNYLYSQRPIVFQGVVGQAISLFQTYQFNLMQQLFKHIAEGDSKTAYMLLGLQGSIYGLNGMPAFNFLNTHIVGNASGNSSHGDLYQAAYSVAGKTMGDWLLYGAGSNALGIVDPSLKTNLYSRGDINPRQLTILPTQVADVPIVSASVKFVQNLYGASEKIAQGGAFWPTMSQAIEHNGLSRPLSGLAAIAQGYTTTNKGSLLTSGQDFYNVATLTRLAGAKPFDEATALDTLYRVNAYKAKDATNIAELGSTIRTTLIGGKNPTSEQINNFASEYVKVGGKIENFNGFFANAAMTSNRSQVNALASNLSNSYARQMQVVMGGRELPDFTNELPQ